jgi:hypothetical protein
VLKDLNFIEHKETLMGMQEAEKEELLSVLENDSKFLASN